MSQADSDRAALFAAYAPYRRVLTLALAAEFAAAVTPPVVAGGAGDDVLAHLAAAYRGGGGVSFALPLAPAAAAAVAGRADHAAGRLAATRGDRGRAARRAAARERWRLARCASRAAFVEAEAAQALALGLTWARRHAGPGCGDPCRAAAWRPTEHACFDSGGPTPWLCDCHFEYASAPTPAAAPGATPPTPGDPLTALTGFADWDADQLDEMEEWELRGITPDQAVAVLAARGGRLTGSTRSILEAVAARRQPGPLATGLRGTVEPVPGQQAAARMTGAARQAALYRRLVAVGSRASAEVACRHLEVAGWDRRLTGHLGGRLGGPGAPGRADFAAGGLDHPRRALHEALARAALNPAAGGQPWQTPLAVVALGPPAGGKSSAGLPLCRGLATAWTRIDAPALAAGLPEYQGWNAPLLHAEAEDICALLRARAVALRHNVFIEHPGHDQVEVADLLGQLRAGGYEVRLGHAHAPGTEAQARAQARFAAWTGPLGGTAPYCRPQAVAASASASAACYAALAAAPERAGLAGWCQYYWRPDAGAGGAFAGGAVEIADRGGAW